MSGGRIQIAAPHLDGDEARLVAECLETNWISSAGRFIAEFEHEFAGFCQVRHAIATCNGTVALHLALTALGIGPGDEVLVPTMTYIATANAVRYCGATTVLVDSEPIGLSIDPEACERAITPRTKAIIPVHLFGHPADMTALKALGDEYLLAVVEDAAEAHGATVTGRPVGGLGTCAAFSFYGNKIITTGEGGMVTTDDDQLAAQLRLLRGQGMDPERRYWFPIVGFNYRMTNIEAAIGLGQLRKIGSKLQSRDNVARWYAENLADTPIGLPQKAEWCETVNWLYTVRLPVDTHDQRNRLMTLMETDGIETRPTFYPMHQMPPYRDLDGDYPVADRFSAQGLSLPTHTQLTRSDVDRICERLSYHLATVSGSDR